MQTFKLYIQSFVDVITNSSTTIYTLYDENGVKTIKDALTEIIHIFEPDRCCDDYFDIHIEYDDEFLEDLDHYQDELFDPSTTNEESLLDYPAKLEAIAEERCDEFPDGGSWPYALEIIPKSEKYRDVAKQLFNLIEPFQHHAVFD